MSVAAKEVWETEKCEGNNVGIFSSQVFFLLLSLTSFLNRKLKSLICVMCIFSLVSVCQLPKGAASPCPLKCYMSSLSGEETLRI